MPDYYLNALQLNDATVQCKLIEYSINKSFNNNKTHQYNNHKVLLFPVSSNNDSYVFEFSLWTRSGTYKNLLDREKQIYDLINDHINNHETLAFSSSEPVWFDELATIYLLFDEASFASRATDGKQFISIKLQGVVESVV